MRLEKYLSESINTKKKIIDKLFTDCGEYLNAIGVYTPLDIHENMIKFYRGETRKFNTYTKLSPKLRHSTGTKADYIHVINKELKTVGYIPRDLCAYGTSNKERAKNFNTNIGLIFPIRNFWLYIY